MENRQRNSPLQICQLRSKTGNDIRANGKLNASCSGSAWNGGELSWKQMQQPRRKPRGGWMNARGRVSNLRIPYCATCIARLFYSGAGYIHTCLYSVLDEKRTSDIFYPLSVGKIIRIGGERPLTLVYIYIFIRINWNFVWLWEIEIRYRIFGNYRQSEGIN